MRAEKLWNILVVVTGFGRPSDAIRMFLLLNMLYKLIERNRNRWLNSKDCTVKNLIDYMESKGLLRDAQLESIKTFLYLKLECNNEPLWKLMYEGKFNTLDIRDLRLGDSVKNFLESHKEAAALYEYAIVKKDDGTLTAPNLVELIENNPEQIEYEEVIKELLYNTTYVDYLFSIPMGAGKTWLMAMFVYLNLYFAINEPDNPLFAHNFIIVAPAGLKSSILPSITKDLRDFDPTIIFPEPLASNLKSIVKLEILGESGSAKGSNMVKNPNAQRVQLHQPFDTLMGLVMITNAEKLYDRIDKSETVPTVWDSLPENERKEWLNIQLANELREIIAKVPNLCVMVDEMHHASEEQQLRKVIEKWVETSSFNSLLGFSGTPYFSSNKTIKISVDLKLKYNMLGNVVTYYPLAKAVNNFLKFPIIKHSEVSNLDIVRNGVKDFLSRYSDKFYEGVGCAKLVIYCGYISTLENEIYPEVCSICQEFNLPTNETILRYYGNDNKEGFRCAKTAQSDFLALDTPFSKYKIILLAQIGKEGWNCKSLTGVILPNPNSSVRNMVLQTSCRCLREVKNARDEEALIWLSEHNHDLLNEELRKKHHTSVAELSSKRTTPEVKRYSRQDVVNLPLLSYIQLHIKYSTIYQGKNNIAERLTKIVPVETTKKVVTQSDLAGHSEIIGNALIDEIDEPMPYLQWVYLISKESFGLIKTSELKQYDSILRRIYNSVSYDKNGNHFLSKHYQQITLRSDIRKCFSPQIEIKCEEELIPRSASLLNLETLQKPYYPSENRIIFPKSQIVDEIISADKAHQIPDEIKNAIDSLRSIGNNVAADALESQFNTQGDPRNNRTYQYIPYSFDSGLEKKYYDEILRGLLKKFEKIEIYYNGDESMTDFYIECYDKSNGYWKRIGDYFPDFLILKRDLSNNQITKVILAETKGSPYETSFLPKKKFMEKFIAINNASNSTKFEFLYIPESFDDVRQYNETKQKIENFLNA